MLLSDYIKTSIKNLSPLYPEEEARSMVMYYCTEVFGFPVYQHITEPATEIPAELLDVALGIQHLTHLTMLCKTPELEIII